jgi:hypothetical protein
MNFANGGWVWFVILPAGYLLGAVLMYVALGRPQRRRPVGSKGAATDLGVSLFWPVLLPAALALVAFAAATVLWSDMTARPDGGERDEQA